MLKDLPFYEKACEVDEKARQEHLDQLEEKRQEWMLRKTPGEKEPGKKKGRGSSPTVHPPAAKKKKKTIAQALKIVSPPSDL